MFGVDKSSNTASLLCFGDGMNGKCCLTGRLRTVYLNNSSAWITAHSERHIQADAAGRNNAYILYLLVAQLHDGAFSKVFFYFRHRCLQGFQLAFLYLVWFHSLLVYEFHL